MAIVTIGIPVFNEGDYLSETIDSAIKQTLSDIKIIISDNASTDKSFEIASEYSKRDPRVRVVRQKENIGPINNFRYLLDETKTPYFVWLGGHDVFVNDYLEKAVNNLENDQGTVMVYPGRAVFIDKTNNYLSGNACSNISTLGIRHPLKRVKHIVENLQFCTNIHGVFRADVLRQLPFEKVIGPDNLMLALAGVFGHICEIDTIGIRRREIRTEDYCQQRKRWEDAGVFSNKKGVDPYKKLIDLHLRYIKNSKEIGLLDKILNSYSLHEVLYSTYLGPEYFKNQSYDVANRALDSKTKTRGLSVLGASIKKSPGLVFSRAILVAAKRILFTKNMPARSLKSS